MRPAGEMWSVVTESPNSAMMRARAPSARPPAAPASVRPGCTKSSKNGGSAM
jgi:hypothetical protein